MRNVADKSCRKKSEHTFCVQEPFSENRAVYEKMWKNIVERRRPHDNVAHGHCMLDT
jgi:hypothetical protein